MNDLYYESRPVFFLTIGFLAIVFSVSAFMTLAGWTVIGCTSTILHARLRNRGIIK